MQPQDATPVKRVDRDFEDLSREYGPVVLLLYKAFTTWWLLRLVAPYIDRGLAWIYTTDRKGETMRDPVPQLHRAPTLLARFDTWLWVHDTRTVRAFRRIALDLKAGTVIEIKESFGVLLWRETQENTAKLVFIMLLSVVCVLWLEYHHAICWRLAVSTASLTTLVQ